MASQLFAWQGIQVETPEEFCPAVLQGDARAGYCRLDDGERVRLEIRWQTPRTSAPVSDVVDRYLKSRAREIQRAGLRVTRRVDPVQIPGLECERFEIHGEREESHLAARCLECRRVALIRFFPGARESSAGEAEPLFRSYRHHSRDGLIPWSVFGLRFDVPERYALRHRNLVAGRLEMEFAARGLSARAIRLALAHVVLGRISLREWLEQETCGRSKNQKCEFIESRLKDHSAVEGSARVRTGLSGFLGRETFLRSRAWHCEEENALYAACWRGPERDLPEFESFARSFHCA